MLKFASFQLDELSETPIAERFRFLKKTEVNFDIAGFTNYLQTMEGGNKDVGPAKAIAAHVRGYFRHTPDRSPPHQALLEYQSLQQYFTHLKGTMEFAATTIAEKLRAIRQAIEYVAYENESDRDLVTRCLSVAARLKQWGKALTKDIRKQRNDCYIKASDEVTSDKIFSRLC